jgi:inhibitor of cysteine peptidase
MDRYRFARIPALAVALAVGLSLSAAASAETGEDMQLLDREIAPITASGSQVAASFSMQRFASCEDMESRLYDLYKNIPYGRVGMLDYATDDMATTSVSNAPVDAGKGTSTLETATPVAAPQVNDEHSTTNVQVLGVDESERVKTDGRYIYYSDDSDRRVYIADASHPDAVRVIKSIKIPDSFSSPELFLSKNKLVILASKYVPYDASTSGAGYWLDRSTRSVVIVYDTSDINNLKLERYELLDGSLDRSRMIGNVLYVVSSTYVNPPYAFSYAAGDLKRADFENAFTPQSLLPKYAEMRQVDDVSEGNVTVRGKKMPYRVSAGTSGTCSDIAYVLPDAATVAQFGFTPRFVTVSALDTAQPESAVKTDVIFGDMNEIYMSLDNLYVTSRLYDANPGSFRCPPGAMCILPSWGISTTNTLIHKFAVKNLDVEYSATAFVPGEPLNQYSMDQSGSGSFRIVTSRWYPERSTSVYTLDKNLKQIGSLERLAVGEDFKSSRYIGDKLFLVTFRAIDPLFVIDMADDTKPKVVGELKMPGYSTYLHPYDDRHLIGLGYDTKENQWGGTQNSGVQVSLYDIDYSQHETVASRCGSLEAADPTRYESCKADVDPTRIRVSQVAAKTFGQNGSSSEALSNPRLFVWNPARKILSLPVTLFYQADASRPYDNTDAFQGALVLGIDPATGISERREITHLDTTSAATDRERECKQYSLAITTEPVCRKLLGGAEYCPSQTTYVPAYCYEDSSVESYIAANFWSYQRSFVTRSLYIGSNLFVISDDKMTVHDMDGSFEQTASIDWSK